MPSHWWVKSHPGASARSLVGGARSEGPVAGPRDTTEIHLWSALCPDCSKPQNPVTSSLHLPLFAALCPSPPVFAPVSLFKLLAHSLGLELSMYTSPHLCTSELAERTLAFPSLATPCLPAQKEFVQSLSHVQLFVTPWTAESQASPSFTISLSLLKLMSIKSVMPSNHLIVCHPHSPPALNLSQHQSSSSNQVAKLLELQF